jgi:hypothetical protein
LLRREHLLDLPVRLLDLFANARADAGEVGLDARVMTLNDLCDLRLLRIGELEAPVEALHESVSRECRQRSPTMKNPVPDHADGHARDERHGERDHGDDRGLSSGHDTYLRPS